MQRLFALSHRYCVCVYGDASCSARRAGVKTQRDSAVASNTLHSLAHVADKSASVVVNAAIVSRCRRLEAVGPSGLLAVGLSPLHLFSTLAR